MRRQMAIAIVVLLAFVGNLHADGQLVTQLRTLGKAVDDMSANISNAASDSDAQLLANVTRQALDNGLKQDRPTIEIKASGGFCRVTIETSGWKLWSEAHKGKITDHGATVR